MQKLNDLDLTWIIRRLPRQVMGLLREKGPKLFLAGGYIRAVIAREECSDIDLFSPNNFDASSGADQLMRGAPAWECIYSTKYAHTVRHLKIPVQFIHKWTFDSPEACVASFDFTIAQAAVWYDNGWRSICADTFYQDLAARRLVYTAPQRIEEAGGSLLRLLKFYRKGYTAPLDSIAGVMARATVALDVRQVVGAEGDWDEAKTSHVLRGLLVEVDPNGDPERAFYQKDTPPTPDEAGIAGI